MMRINQGGFTLLELLIAMAVFALMAVMTYTGLHGLLSTQKATALRSAQLEALQMTFYLMNEDLSQIAPRTVRDGYGLVESAFRSDRADGELFTLTRSVQLWSGLAEGSALQRVSYRLEKGALYRLVWTTLDRTQQSAMQRRKLLDVAQVQLRFFDLDWADFWLANVNSVKSPKAVEVSLTVGDLGVVKRIFYVHP